MDDKLGCVWRLNMRSIRLCFRVEWEELSILPNFLIFKIAVPKDEDLNE